MAAGRAEAQQPGRVPGLMTALKSVVACRYATERSPGPRWGDMTQADLSAVESILTLLGAIAGAFIINRYTDLMGFHLTAIAWTAVLTVVVIQVARSDFLAEMIGPVLRPYMTKHPVWFLVACGAVGAALFIAAGFLFERTYDKVEEKMATQRAGRNQPIAPQGGTAPPAPAKQSLRLKYSDTQVVQVSSAPGNYNVTLNLDNTGVALHQFGLANLDAVEMVASSSPLLTIDRPRAGEKYSAGDTIVKFPAADTPGVFIESARIYPSGRSIVFDRTTSATATFTIEVDDRKFRIVLMAVRDKSKGKHKLLEYTFGISEE